MDSLVAMLDNFIKRAEQLTLYVKAMHYISAMCLLGKLIILFSWFFNIFCIVIHFEIQNYIQHLVFGKILFYISVNYDNEHPGSTVSLKSKV